MLIQGLVGEVWTTIQGNFSSILQGCLCVLSISDMIVGVVGIVSSSLF
jgi:hypothetical protein